MPTPNPGESQDDFMERCIPLLSQEGKEQEQAVAACTAIWEESEASYQQLLPLNGIEIFRAGEWNGDKYSEDDLDEMVSNFGKVGYDIPLKLGHSEDTGEPAYGWVAALRRVGDRLVADLRDLPKKVYEAIKDRRFDAISAEIFWNLKRNGKKFRRALKAVALLGAETPAVAGLKPLRDVLRGFSEAELATIHSHELKKEILMAKQMDGGRPKAAKTKHFQATPEDGESQDDFMKRCVSAAMEGGKTEEEANSACELAWDEEQPLPAETKQSGVEIRRLIEQVDALTARLKGAEARERKAEIDRKVEAIKIPALREHFHALYELALAEGAPKTVTFAIKDKDGKPATRQDAPVAVVDDLVARINVHVAKLFSELGRTDMDRAEGAALDNPGAEVNRLAKLHMQAHPKTKYSEALTAVLSAPENEELKLAYATRRAG